MSQDAGKCTPYVALRTEYVCRNYVMQARASYIQTYIRPRDVDIGYRSGVTLDALPHRSFQVRG